MKIQINRPEFIKAWQMAERVVNPKGTIPALGGIMLTAEGRRVTLSATDMRMSLRCVTGGVEADSSGSAMLPVKLLGELFKKAPEDVFTVDFKDDKGTMVAGRNKTRFTSWSAADFPDLPKIGDADLLCSVSASDLLRLLSEGSAAGSVTDEFPKYLGACLVQLKSGKLNVISTDAQRLSLSRRTVEMADREGGQAEPEGSSDLLIPVGPLRELQRMITPFAAKDDNRIEILYDSSLAWFRFGIDEERVEFSVRRVESSFPNYERLLDPNSTTSVVVNRGGLIASLERIDPVVRHRNRIVVMYVSPGAETIRMSGKAPETGIAVERLQADSEGEAMRAGFNVGYLLDGLRSIDSENVRLNMNGEAGQLTMGRSNADDFLYILMPVRLADQDIVEEGEEDGERRPEPEPEPVEALPF
ncbi:MAG: DNA polymerase III subunit beta [Synergistaceae bacterium]|jgi:DNA polymerase-3 subunit beta|nr:DNA polymerase III subunit beta [Synergistaceae bacterium]